MPKTYTKCSTDIRDIIDDVMKAYHGDLHREHVTIEALYVENIKKKTGEQLVALKKDGMAVAAQIKITPLDQRVLGHADAKLTIDTLAWTRLSANSKRALIDHEIQHLALARDKKRGFVKYDDHGRPQLKIRPHDWELTGFSSVVERHGESAVEAIAIRRFSADFHQLGLFAEHASMRRKADESAEAALH